MTAVHERGTKLEQEVEAMVDEGGPSEGSAAGHEADEGNAECAESCSSEGSNGEKDSGDAGFAEQVKKIALAAAEAVHVSPEDVKGFVTRLVEKGELAQQDGLRIVQDIGVRLRRAVREPVSTAREAAEQAEGAIKSLADRLGRRNGDGGENPDALQGVADRIHASIERVLDAMHIASASQVDQIREQLEALDKKFDDLNERLG